MNLFTDFEESYKSLEISYPNIKEFEKKYNVSKTKVGDADIRFMKQRDIVDFAVQWIEKNRK